MLCTLQYIGQLSYKKKTTLISPSAKYQYLVIFVATENQF